MTRKRRITVATFARGAGRATVAAIFVGVLALCIMQVAHVTLMNVALARDLAAERAHDASVGERIERDRRAIERLRTPAGAIPEIHDELQLVGPGESIIYVKTPGTPPAPGAASP